MTNERKYIGARYVPLIMGEWDNSNTYEPLSIVMHEGNSYTTRQFVPAGIQITDNAYWAETGNYNAQVEQYRQEVAAFDDRITMNADCASITANPIYYGADPSGVSDSTVAIQNCIDANDGGTVHFSPGIYKISAPIETGYETTTSIDFHGAKLVTDEYCNCALYIGHKNSTTEHSGGSGGIHDKYPDRVATFQNFYIEAHGDYAIRVENWYLNPHFLDFTIYAYKDSVEVGTNSNHPIDAYFDNFYICADDMSLPYTGIKNYGTDSKYTNGRIYAFKTAIESTTSIHLINVHFLATNLTNIVDFNNDYIAIDFRGNSRNSIITDCYCDSYPTFIKGHADMFINCTIKGFKMNQWHQMDSGDGCIVDLSEASNRAHMLIIQDAYIDNENGKYNLFQVVKANKTTWEWLFSNGSIFEGIALSSTTAANTQDLATKYDLVNGALMARESKFQPNNTLANITGGNWCLIGRIATSRAGTYEYLTVHSTQGNLIGVFSIDVNGSGEITSITKMSGELHLGVSKHGGNTHPSGNYDLYYMRDSNYINNVVIEASNNFYKLIKPNILPYMTAPVTTATAPEVVSA